MVVLLPRVPPGRCVCLVYGYITTASLPMQGNNTGIILFFGGVWGFYASGRKKKIIRVLYSIPGHVVAVGGAGTADQTRATRPAGMSAGRMSLSGLGQPILSPLDSLSISQTVALHTIK